MSLPHRIQYVQQMRRQQRVSFISSMGRLRKGSIAPAAEIALMTMAVHEDRALVRDCAGVYNVPDHPRDADGAFKGKGFHAATIGKLVRAGRVEVRQFNANGVPTVVTLKPM